jgi:WD40 repeat protein
MSSTRAANAPLAAVIVCAPEDAPALRTVAQRLRADGLTVALAAELRAESGGSPRALREALRSAGAVVVCLSRRATAGGALVPDIADILELVAATPAPARLLVALRLTSAELPPALRSAAVLDLFSASGYQRLLEDLRAHAAALAPPAPPPEPEPAPPPPEVPALKLSGGFGLPALDRQGMVRRLGRGVARAVFLVGGGHALVISGGGPALVSLGGGPPRWAIDCPTRRAALGPSGRLLALAAGSQIFLWDLADGRMVGVCGGHTDTVGGLAFAPDERTLASASHDRSVRLWRIGDGASPPTALATLLDHADQATSVCFSPDGALLAAGGADRTVRVWRTLDRSRVQTLPGHGGAVEALAFSPDGATLAAGSRGRTVRLWDARAWRPLHTLEGHEGAVEALTFSPDGALIATGSSDRTARLWQTGDGAPRLTLAAHSGPVVGVAFSPDGATLATVGEDERLLAWDVAGGAQTASLRPLSGRVTGLALSDDGALLAVGAGGGSLAVYGFETGGTPRTRYDDHRGAVGSLAFAEGGRLITASGDRTVRACPPEGGPSSVLLQTHGALQGAALSRDGRLLASSDGEGTVQLWRLSGPAEAPGGQFWRVLRGLRGRPRRIAFAPRADVVAVATDDGGVSIWPLAALAADQAEPAVTLRTPGGPARSLAFSADGALLAAGTDSGAVQLWHAGSGVPAAAVHTQGRAVSSLAFAPDARALAAGDAGGAVLIWRLALGDSRRRQHAPTIIHGHAGAVEHLAFAPGGALVSGSSDGTVRVWKV